ncbi:uncharacterized protein LOC123444592 [Hordeum vulgare subsp. vulgare]|uniref:uncharacterized protein LOC123444592 n=1 Tax=Hordeum vulgare subsp. vulgare TaxID=112509 RepID=UPI001D1A4254|nr:uncharacterized protein LOC123444592 [Hordeum vulgare subsp. vulgare]
MYAGFFLPSVHLPRRQELLRRTGRFRKEEPKRAASPDLAGRPAAAPSTPDLAVPVPLNAISLHPRPPSCITLPFLSPASPARHQWRTACTGAVPLREETRTHRPSAPAPSLATKPAVMDGNLTWVPDRMDSSSATRINVRVCAYAEFGDNGTQVWHPIRDELKVLDKDCVNFKDFSEELSVLGHPVCSDKRATKL